MPRARSAKTPGPGGRPRRVRLAGGVALVVAAVVLDELLEREHLLVGGRLAVDELLEARVTEMVQTLLATSPAASRATKALLSEVAQAPASAATRERCCEVISQLRVSEQGQAGLAAFFAGTPAPWVPTENQTTETSKSS